MAIIFNDGESNFACPDYCYQFGYNVEEWSLEKTVRSEANLYGVYIESGYSEVAIACILNFINKLCYYETGLREWSNFNKTPGGREQLVRRTL